ncbi:hypothetical protein AMTR_s00217p00024980 [Amborella trichopoda]|nr:hypothetical protein AMTR_s00217p00024980 [Amborella trichopoda]
MDFEVIPGLPDEIGWECLVRAEQTSHAAMRLVRKSWQELIASPDSYKCRKATGKTQKYACLVRSLTSPSLRGAKQEVQRPLAYGLTLFEPRTRQWTRVPPIPAYPDGLPLFC